MYFENRTQAGWVLAAELIDRYRYENCVVVALNDGGVIVGEQIAAELHCVLTMLVAETIDIPGEGINIGAVSQEGKFTYNGDLTRGEITGYMQEFHGYLEEEKREAFQRVNRLIGDGGTINRDLLREQNIILVSDGFDDGSRLDVAMDFLKPIRIQRLVVAAPVASVSAVDRLHVIADELHILDVKANYMGTNHYYTDNNLPSREDLVVKINQMILNWR